VLKQQGTDILIVGAGPTGLMLGIELARRGVPFRLVERLPAPLEWDRATVVHSRSLEIFETIGAAEQFLDDGQVIGSVGFLDRGRKVGSLQLGGIDSRFPFDVNISEELTESILTSRLEALGGRVERGVEFTTLEQTGEIVDVSLRSHDGGSEQVVKASFVVGTDGHRSPVRQAIECEFEAHDYPARWGVVDGNISGWRHPPDETAVQLESPGVNPLPLPDGRHRIYFRATSPDANALTAVSEALTVMSPGAQLEDPDEPQFFRTRFRIAESYRTGRVLLAGDAAHMCSPIQGHGMNAGVQDAYNLGWKLALVARRAAPDTLLDSYEAERRPVADAIGRSGAAAEKRSAEPDDATTQAIMERLATAEGTRLAAIGTSEIGFAYEESPIVGEVMLPARPSATKRGVCLDVVCLGARVGDAEQLLQPDSQLRLHELIQSPWFTLLVLLDSADASATQRELERARQLAAKHHPHLRAFVATRRDIRFPDARSEHVWDSTGALHARFQAEEPTLCLIRPDGHLGFRAEPMSWDALDAHLSTVMPTE
jgi:2-polyprenyl-6-methoxyphenol hydroxylase-like FAD-dependent oxidoreductase